MMWFLLFVVVTMIPGLIRERYGRRAKERRRERLEAREPMTGREVWERWYQVTEVVIEDVEEVRAAVALDVEVSALLLRPSDDLGKELGFEGYEFDDSDELESWVDRRIRAARRRGKKVKFKPFDTVDDAIRFSARLRC